MKTSMKSKTRIDDCRPAVFCVLMHVWDHKNFSVCEQPPVYKLRGRHFRVVHRPPTNVSFGHAQTGVKFPPECPASEAFRRERDWVAMELEHPADSVTIVEEDEEEGRGKRGRESRLAEVNKVILVPETH